MKTVIVAYGPVSGSYQICGEYLKSYDPEAHDGFGDATFTTDINKALVFDTFAAALLFTRQQPANRPLRADGRPNRPLTAFTLEYKDVHSR